MKGVNKAILVGTLGKDPESKTFANGGVLCQFSIATTEKWKDKTTGELKEQTEWHRIVCNGRLAEIAQQYLRKGSKIYVEGSLKTRQWKDQNNQDRYTTEINCRELQMLDSKGDSNYQQGNQSKPQQGYTAQPQTSQNSGGGYSDLDDDLPFMRLDSRLV